MKLTSVLLAGALVASLGFVQEASADRGKRWRRGASVRLVVPRPVVVVQPRRVVVSRPVVVSAPVVVAPPPAPVYYDSDGYDYDSGYDQGYEHDYRHDDRYDDDWDSDSDSDSDRRRRHRHRGDCHPSASPPPPPYSTRPVYYPPPQPVYYPPPQPVYYPPQPITIQPYPYPASGVSAGSSNSVTVVSRPHAAPVVRARASAAVRIGF